MPYIKDFNKRLTIDAHIYDLLQEVHNEGDLNYTITKICLVYLSKFSLSYAILNTIIGTLSCVLSEFYRRVVAPYEDKKIEENGDIKEFSNNKL